MQAQADRAAGNDMPSGLPVKRNHGF
jgi:hypothetical protein